MKKYFNPCSLGGKTVNKGYLLIPHLNPSPNREGLAFLCLEDGRIEVKLKS
jgi:hypothetical protein